MSCPVSQSDQEVTSSCVSWDNNPVDLAQNNATMDIQEQDVDSTMPDSTSQDVVNPNALFAAALTAKLDSLSETVRGSPSDLGEYENPDSMETQGDALCVGSGPPSIGSRDPLADIAEFDLTTSDALGDSPNAYTVPDCDPNSNFPSSILPTFGPLPDPAQDTGYDDTITGIMFNEEPATLESGDITSDLAVPGVCGMRNLGNTCYMNSGLQCLLSSPTVTEYFLHFSPEIIKTDQGEEDRKEETKSNTCLRLSRHFASLVEQVYSGRFSVIQPGQFKDTLGESHDQFKGFRQHDCQEFLALLLDTLHEQLVGLGGRAAILPMSECTSMELHTPHSTEVSCTEGSTVFNFSLSGKMLDKDSESEVGRADLDREFESVSEVGRADLENVMNIDGTESRGSASPKSYTSHSSLEDKIPTNIRMAPIPECMKTDWPGQEHQADSRASLASLDSEQEEGSEEGEGAAITSNLVPNDQLKKKQVVFSDTVGGGLGVQERNNAVSPMNVGIEDFYKEHKTLNVNMNNESHAMNNKINFDSEKYRHTDNTRPPTTIENLNAKLAQLSEKNINVKRVKCTNMETGGLGEVCGGETDNKRIRLESREKNMMMETERREVESESMESQTEPPNLCSEAARDPARLKEAIEADRYWEKYLAKNNTVVAHSFQGQFKNKVICGECGHASVSFEPFMYLSVPLPRALDRQVEVVVLLEGDLPTTHLLTLSTHDRVLDLRAALTAKLELADRKLVLAEVTRHRVTRQLEDNTWLKFVNTTNRKLYCLELLSVAPEEEKVESVEDEEGVSSSMLSSQSSSRSDLCPSTTVSSSTSTGTLTDTGTITEEVSLGAGGDTASSSWKSCNICLEDMVDSDLVSHIHCTAQLCRECLDRSMTASPDKCPVCLATVWDNSEWVQLDQSSGVRPPLRMLTIPVVIMTEQEDKDEYLRMGHPRLLRVANIVKLGSVVKLLESIISSAGPVHYQALCVVAETGDWCSRCTSQQRCRGCPLSSLVDGGDLLLKPGDNIAIKFPMVGQNVMDEVNRVRHDPSMEVERLKQELDLFDCLDAFSSREVLDQANPWFCPICRRNQTATKTLSVWRYPDFLVIYLKRFVYLEKGPGGLAGSVKLDNKVTFPLAGLDLTPYLSGPLQKGGEMFDLYGAVCHYGSVSGGHYTAYAKHCQTQQWNHFNDAQVDPRVPEGECQDDVYVLFYKRSGLSHTVNLPCSDDKPENPPP